MATNQTIQNKSGGTIFSGDADHFVHAIQKAIAASASLDSANFKGRDLHGVDFSSATVTNADFTQCDLRGCKFGGKSVSGAKFHEADTRGVVW